MSPRTNRIGKSKPKEKKKIKRNWLNNRGEKLGFDFTRKSSSHEI